MENLYDFENWMKRSHPAVNENLYTKAMAKDSKMWKENFTNF
jgi:hypothetical protein